MVAIEAAPSSAPVAGAKALTQQHALIRNADEYADLFAHAATATADANDTEQGGRMMTPRLPTWSSFRLLGPSLARSHLDCL